MPLRPRQRGDGQLQLVNARPENARLGISAVICILDLAADGGDFGRVEELDGLDLRRVRDRKPGCLLARTIALFLQAPARQKGAMSQSENEGARERENEGAKEGGGSETTCM